MLTRAARAAASRLNKPPLVAARGAREGLWLEQVASHGRRTGASPVNICQTLPGLPQAKRPGGAFWSQRETSQYSRIVKLARLHFARTAAARALTRGARASLTDDICLPWPFSLGEKR